MTCQLPYHKSKDNLTSFLFETGAISEVGNNILDLDLFRQVTKQINNDLNQSYGIQASPFVEDDLTGSQTFYTNDKIFERIDEVRKELGLYDDRIAGSYIRRENNTADSSLNNLYQYSSEQAEGIISSEKTIRDLSARISDRIGIPYRIISDRTEQFKGKIENNIPIINLAYATLDTPIHEILGHPIIRAIKNRKDKVGYVETSKSSAIKEGYQWTLETTGGFWSEKNDEVKYYYQAENGERTESFTTKEQAEKALQDLKDNYNKTLESENSTLYQNLLKELEYGRGKEVLDRIKRDYTNKNTTEYFIKKEEEIFNPSLGKYRYTLIDKNDLNKPNLVFYNETQAQKELEKLSVVQDYTLEEQQEEAIVELLGMMTAEKLDVVKDGKLISLLKRLLKEIKSFVKSLLSQREVEIDKLPDNMTLGDLSDLLAYSNSKLILPGYEVEYTTPDNNKFKTYAEASNHISQLSKSVVDVDLSGVKIQNNTSVTSSSEIPVNEFSAIGNDYDVFRKDPVTEEWVYGNTYLPVPEDAVVRAYNMSIKYNSINGFIDTNKEYEQSKVIIEEWKKINNISYNPEEIYSRGQEFASVVGAYSSFDVNLMMQNLLAHIEDNEKAGGKFAISAFTKPVDRQIGHLEGGGGKIKFKIYPQSKDILWAANRDAYSGSVWDASLRVNKDKKSELLGVSYTKYPSLQNVSAVQPNLASIVDDLSDHHNELGIVLTGNNFRLEYDEDIPYQTKKIIDGINGILDSKYGKLVKPNINIRKPITKESAYIRQVDSENNIIEFIIPEFDDKGNVVYANRITHQNNKYYFEPEFTSSFGRPDETLEITKERFDSLLEEYKDQLQPYLNEVKPLVTEKTLKVSIEGVKNQIDESEDWDGTITPESEKRELEKEQKYTTQALINTKIAKLKEVSKKYPRSLIRSEVVPVNRNYTNSYRQFDGELPFQLVPSTNKEITPELYQTLVNFVKKVNPDFKVEVLDDLLASKGVHGLVDFKNFLIQLNQGSQSAMAEETAHVFFELMEDSNPLKQRMLSEITNTRIYKQTVKEYREIYGNDVSKLKSEAAAKLISLYLTDKDLAKKMSGSDSLWENIQRWMSDFFRWIKGRPKTFSSFLESAEKIVNLDTSGLHLDKAYTLEEMYSLGDYVEKIKILESVRNTNVAGLDMLYFNLNDTLFNYKDYPGTSNEKRKFLFDAAKTAERDKYYQNVNLTTLGRELKDKIRFIGPEKVTIYTQMYVSPALEARLKNEFGNIKIERVNVTQVVEDEDGNVIKEIQTNSLQDVLDRDNYSKMLIVDNGKPTLNKPYNIVKYNERKASYDILEKRLEREKQKEGRNKVTQDFLNELNRVNEYKEGSVTEQVMKTFRLIKGELLDIEKTERILENMGDEEVSKLFRDQYGNLGLPLKNIDAAKKLIEETDRYGDALKQFLATIEGTIGFFKERNDNGYQVTKDLIEKGNLESLERAIYELSKITKIGTAWQEYIGDFRKLIKDVPNTSTVDTLLGELDTQIQRTKDIAHDLNIKVLSERLSNEFAAYNWTKEARASEIQEKINNSQDPEEIKRYERELKTLKNKGVEDVSRILMGEVPDISSLTVWIKTLYNSRDPLIGSISKLLQKAFAQVETKELQRGQDMGIALREVQEQHSLINKDLEELLVVEKTPVFNSETGEYELKDRWAYMNPWQNRHEYDEKRKPYLESRDKYIKAKQSKDPELESIRKEYLEQKQKFENWETTNWHRPYTEEYYRRYDALKNENPDLFEMLKTESDLIWSDINSKSLLLRGETNPEQKEILNSQIRDLRRELSQIKSEVYFDGTPKVGLDLEKAKLAQRKSEIDNEVHDWSVDNKTFEQDFTIFLNTLDIEDDLRQTYLAFLDGADGNYSKLFQEIKNTAPYELIDWMDSNTLIRYSQEWYDQRSKITEDISEISNKLSEAYGQTERVDLKETWENLINISSPYRDEDRVLDGSSTSPKIQERILEYEKQIENIKKLVREEREGVYGPEIKALKNQLSKKIEELNEIQNKQTTEAYNDTFVELAESAGMVEEFNRLHPDLYFGYNSRLDVLINTNEFQEFIKDKDNVFTQWYFRNHLTKSYRDSLGQEHFTISPTYLWMKIEPKDDKHILTIPSYRYSERVVKPEYQTVKENWVTWNPISYRWLPKSEQYFNPAYRTLQNRQDSKGIGLKKALRLLTDYHLKTQETAPKEARLEFGVPYVQKRAFEDSVNYFKNIYNEFTDKDNRFEEGEGNFDETVQPESKKGIKNRIISWINGFIGEEEKEEQTPETIKKYTRIAVPYSHYMKIENVSKDIVFSTTAFGFSTSKATKMMHTLPTFKLIEDVLQNNEVTRDKNGRPVSNNVHRLKAVQFAQNHYIYGVNKQYELGEHGKTIDKGLTLMRKINTVGSLAWPFGIANTLKNNLQGRLQNLIGGKFGDWSSNKSMRKAAGNLNTNYFKYLSEIESPQDKRSLDYHIITFFNPHQMGDIAFNLHKGGRSRIMQDKHMFIMNESMEFAISTNLLYGHLYHVKVKKGDEVKDLYSILRYENGIKAEEGWVDYKTGRPVDEDYLLDTKLAHKTAAEYVQGKIGDKTLLGTYTIGQALLYFKNWLIPMIRRRFDSKKENYMIGEDIEGYWKTFLRVNLTMMRDLMKDGKMYWHTFSPEEKRNYITTLNEIAFVIISSLLIGLVYGFDADDKDKFKKLKENSYAENLTLLIALQAKAETEMLTFMPFFNVESQAVPPVLTELPKVIMNPTIGFSLVNDLWKTINAGYSHLTGDEGAYYQQNMPAYNIEKGDSKFVHYGLKFFQIDNILYSIDNPEGKLVTVIGMMKR